MVSEAQVIMTGYVATQPRMREIAKGVQVVSMRVAWTPRHVDRGTGEWTDGVTSFATVTCWRKLAENVGACVHKGDPVIIRGRFRNGRTYTDKSGVQRREDEIEALEMGHDLSRGIAIFRRLQPPLGKTAEEHRAELEAVAAEGGQAAGGGPGAANGLRAAAMREAAEREAAEREAAEQEAAAMAALERAGLAGHDDEIFDPDGIEKLAQDADSAAVPS
jgi:single-strand DNA-binding protein